jgi:RNA polymerase-binding transcription factor DksA
MTSTTIAPLESRRAQLKARQAELEARLLDIEGQLDEPASRDDDDRATEREADEVLETMGQASQKEIRAIEAALARMADGEYGFCVQCGDRISEERLDVVPWAPLCRKCATGH